MDGRYERRGVIGEGATSVVYRAHDTVLDRSIALKELILEGSEDIALEEARAAARISHPNVVTVHDVFTDGGRPVIAMEYLEGPTLRDELDSIGTFPLDAVFNIAGQIAASLAAAHEAGIVHRDIKPDNVFLLGPRVVVTDFGMALSSLRGGTPGYMSPEQWENAAPAPSSDIFAWGCLTFECITGVLPFGIDNLAIREPPEVGVVSGYGPLDDLLARCLASDPTRRPRDGRALVGELALLGSGPPAVASRPRSVSPNPPAAAPEPRAAAGQLVMTVYMADGRSWAVAVSGGADLGRESELLIPDDLASRRHARVYPVDGYWIISDLDSLNGTAVNGVHIQSAPLSPGDHVTIGGTVLVVEAT